MDLVETRFPIANLNPWPHRGHENWIHFIPPLPCHPLLCIYAPPVTPCYVFQPPLQLENLTMTDKLQEIWTDQVATITQPAADWLWHGFIARANMTLLTSQWKAGKTTLVSMLLSRRANGGDLGGLAVQPGKTVVVTEEPLPLWAERTRSYQFRNQVCLLSQPFSSIPTSDQWLGLVARLALLHDQHGIDLAVIDPLAPFCRCETQASTILETLLPLGLLIRRGMAVLVLHHPAKGEQPVGQAARGSGALLGHVDISMEMRHPGGDELTRRRRFVALSRHAQTPRRLLMELNAQATDYLPVDDTQPDEFPTHWEHLRMVLDDAPKKLNRQEILDVWPADFPKPCATVLWRWLDRAVKLGLVACEGTGRRYNPFLYWLPECEEIWRKDPLYEFNEKERRVFAMPTHKFDQELILRQLCEIREEQLRKAQASAGDLGDEGEGEDAEMQAYSDSLEEETVGDVDEKSGAHAPVEAPPSAGQDPLAGAPIVAAEAAPAPEAAAATVPADPPSPSPAAEPVPPVTAEAAARLPYPFNIMNPAEVPEWVWKQARLAAEKKRGKRGNCYRE